MIQADSIYSGLEKLLDKFKGDRVIWICILLLCGVSFAAVYSSTLTFAYKTGGGSTSFYIIKHIGISIIGVAFMFLLHRINYMKFSTYANVMYGVSILLLVLTIIFGDNLNSASRWITIPLINISFQTSDLAKVMLIVYMAKFMKNQKQNLHDFRRAFIPLITYVGLICLLIFPNDFSSAAVLFTTCIIIMFIGGINLKFILGTIAAGIFGIVVIYGVATIAPNVLRFGTWKNRIDNYFTGEGDSYQTEQAKIAIAKGGFFGEGPGRSTQRNYLPHPYSDFIYAIILEEYGIMGGGIVLIIYLVILFRVIRMVNRCNKAFGAYLALGLTVFLVFQAFINMGVAVSILPVTGLTLPLISMGGTSVIFVSFAFGMIQSVARYVDEEHLAPINPKMSYAKA